MTDIFKNTRWIFMNISILLMEQIIQLFLMIFMGYLIVKVRLVKDEDSKVLSKIILYLIIPCVIINAFQVDYTMDTVKGLLLALAASVMTQVLLLIIISISGKLLHLNEVEIASVYYSNSGDRTHCDLYSWTGLGFIWMCFYECAAHLSVDTLQKDYQPGIFLRLEKDCVKY